MKQIKAFLAIIAISTSCVDQNKNTYGEFAAELDGVQYKNYDVFASQSTENENLTYALRTENLEEKEFGLVINLTNRKTGQTDFEINDLSGSSISVFEEKDDGYYPIASGKAQIIEKTENSISVNFEGSFTNTKDSSKVIQVKNGLFKINNLNPAVQTQE